MPRSLNFKYRKSSFSCELNKIDRAKIYGTVTVHTVDHEGNDTDLFSLARDGRTLIGLGGTGSGYVNRDGYWVESGERIPVDAEGDPMELIDSSFDSVIALKETVEEDVLLDHPVRLAYHLIGDELPDGIRKKLDGGSIYHFEFSYRGGPVADPAFVLTDTDGDLWLLIGNPTDVEFRSYQQVAICAASSTDEVEDDSEDDNFDFDML
ncbi:MAG: hypothetical protein AB8B63_24615 [Granulosicoccus sp.]